MSLKKLINLLERPHELKLMISSMRLRPNLSEEEQGFLRLYDKFNGDVVLIKSYLNETKKQVLGITERKTEKQLLYRAAAIMILLLSTGLFFFLNQPRIFNSFKKNPIEVTGPDFFKEPGIPIYMSQETSIDWAPLMFTLDKNQPEAALAEWRKVYKIAPKNDTVIYFGGIVFMRMDYVDSAHNLFQKNTKMKSVFSDRAHYYLAEIAKSQGNKAAFIRKMKMLKYTEDQDLKPFVMRELKETK
jgi:hypothetical protein